MIVTKGGPRDDSKEEIANRELEIEHMNPGYLDKKLMLEVLANSIIVYQIIFVAYSYLFLPTLSSGLWQSLFQIFLLWGLFHLILTTGNRVLGLIVLICQVANFVTMIPFLKQIIFIQIFFTIYVVMYLLLVLALVSFLVYVLLGKKARAAIKLTAFVRQGGGVEIRSKMTEINKELEILNQEDASGEGETNTIT